MAEAEAAPQRSKHQEFMHHLNNSGRSLVDIQTAWHEYYNDLPDPEKHEVWQEFYAANQNAAAPAQPAAATSQSGNEQVAAAIKPDAGQPFTAYNPLAKPGSHAARLARTAKNIKKQGIKPASVHAIKKHIRHTVTAGGTLKTKHHLQSLAFGVGAGLLVIFIFLFGFFNEVMLAPFIQPSRTASETPIIVDTASAVVGATPKVLIPKINVEIPVDYSQTTTDETAIEAALDKGIVHYPTTVRPGQVGNAAYFGHSSNNIFNPGKYKFAFVLLHELVIGDTFYLTNDGKAYAYKVISRTVVDPSEVGVLGSYPGVASTATLITCDPPGTSLKRLVVVGEQISPAPDGNTAPGSDAPVVTASTEGSLPGNGQTLLSRLWQSIF